MEKENFALLIIDMQKDFVLPDAPMHIEWAVKSIPAILRVLKVFREKKLPVIHVVREHGKDGLDVEACRFDYFKACGGFCVENTRGAEIIDELKALDGEYIIKKQRFSAFMQTELDFILKRLGINHLVICGTQYPVCIRATAFDALALAYKLTNIKDGSSAKSREIALANIRDMEDLGVFCEKAEDFLKKYSLI